MKKINYVIGDATYPIGYGNKGDKLICHICNDKGYWGKGFVLAVSKRWKTPEKQYRSLNSYVLGTTQFIQVEPDIVIVNMIAQHDIQTKGIITPIRYDALISCFSEIGYCSEENNFSIHMPRIGAGLAGGNWKIIEKLINEYLVKIGGFEVYVYDLPK